MDRVKTMQEAQSMKPVCVFFILLWLSNTVLAAKTPPPISPFNMPLGFYQVEQLVKEYTTAFSGYNNFTNGDMYTVKLQELKDPRFAQGLLRLVAIFDQEGKLQALFAEYPKSDFSKIYKRLNQHYQLVKKDLPWTGPQEAVFRGKNLELHLKTLKNSYKARLMLQSNAYLKTIQERQQAEKKSNF